MGNTASNRLLMAGGGTPPGTPTSFNVSNSTTTPRTVLLSWSAPTTPVAPITGYKIYRGGSLLATQTGTTYTDGEKDYSTLYSYQVYAYNAFGDSPTPASGSVTTFPACNNSSGSVSGGNASTVSVPAGCFKVRIRALSGGGGGGGANYYVHIGSCYPASSGGGGGSYIDGKHSVTPGGTVYVFSGSGGQRTSAGGSSGTSQCYMTGGSPGASQGNPGGQTGQIGVAPPGAGIAWGEDGYNYNAGTNPMDGGGPAYPGGNPTGLFTHGYGANQTCGQCQGCNGPNATGYGGGGAGGTDSGTLYGEAQYPGGSGAPGYAVWNFSES